MRVSQPGWQPEAAGQPGMVFARQLRRRPIRWGVASCLIALAFLCVVARAETPEEVFQRVSASVVVVHVSDAAGIPVGLGSGIVFSRGTVITNCHVAQAGPQLKVSHLGKSFAGTLQYADTDRDLCQLSVPKLDAPSVSVGDSKNLKVGQRVYAVGAPEGLELTLSEGLISALRSGADLRYIQTTASISHGSSGGGLFDTHGRLVGITTFYVSEGQNLNFALPADWIQGLPERAGAEAQAIVNASNGESDWLLRATALQAKSDWQGLLHLSQQWVKGKPKSALAWGVLGEAHTRLGQYDKGREANQESVRLDPQNAGAWVNLGIAHSGLRQYEKARDAEQQALRLDPQNVDAWVSLGHAYSGLGQYDKAREADQEAVRLDPQNATSWANLGIDYLHLGQAVKALEADKEAVRLDPQNATAWRNVGVAYSGLGQYDKAREAVQEALRLEPQNAKAWTNLGVAYDHLGQYDKALGAEQEAIRLDPQNAAAWVNLGLAYRGLGQYDKALEADQEAVRLDPQNAGAWVNLGLDYCLLGRREKAIEVYQQLRQLDSDKAERLFKACIVP
jgi:tetratricopeptide (TPR) repeat protein